MSYREDLVVEEGRDAVHEVVDSQMSTAGLALPSEETGPTADLTLASSDDFWKRAWSDGLHAMQVVKLQRFTVVEWFPRRPGAYWRHGLQRGKYERAINDGYERRDEVIEGLQARFGRNVLSLSEKMQLITTGLGVVRLDQKPTLQGLRWFCCADTAGVADNGVPLALDDSHYASLASRFHEHGGAICDVVGRVRVIPTDLDAMFGQSTGLGRFFIDVEELRPTQARVDDHDGVLANAVVGLALEGRAAAAFSQFDVSKSLEPTVEFLSSFASAYRGKVAVDFDEHTRRFQDARFSLSRVSKGEIESDDFTSFADTWFTTESSRVSQYVDGLLAEQHQVVAIRAENLHLHRDEVVMGDKFEVSGDHVTIVNRSTLNNAMNSVESRFGEEARESLSSIVTAAEDSGNEVAIENAQGLAEELQRETPRKGLVTSMLGAIREALPDVAAVARAAAVLLAAI